MASASYTCIDRSNHVKGGPTTSDCWHSSRSCPTRSSSHLVSVSGDGRGLTAKWASAPRWAVCCTCSHGACMTASLTTGRLTDELCALRTCHRRGAAEPPQRAVAANPTQEAVAAEPPKEAVGWNYGGLAEREAAIARNTLRPGGQGAPTKLVWQRRAMCKRCRSVRPAVVRWLVVDVGRAVVRWPVVDFGRAGLEATSVCGN